MMPDQRHLILIGLYHRVGLLPMAAPTFKRTVELDHEFLLIIFATSVICW